MSIEDNKALVAEFVRRFTTGDIDHSLELFTPDMRWEVWGDLAISGSHDLTAIRALMNQMCGNFVRFPSWTIDGMVAEGDKVAVEAHSSGDTAGGHKYRNRYHMLVSIRDGKISVVKEYMDTKHVQDLIDAQARSTQG